MTLVRQLYSGAGRAIVAVRGTDTPPTSLKNFLGHLTTIPEWLTWWKVSAFRKGALRVLSLVVSHYPDIDPTKVVGGFPEFNSDNSKFD